ncbi:MAG: hypothetical protein K0S74_833 [Chlamydiales bacterium]|jgi:ankyrin repeat protein|nr:hypothetical protein [Chlamydiales bacterium]
MNNSLLDNKCFFLPSPSFDRTDKGAVESNEDTVDKLLLKSQSVQKLFNSAKLGLIESIKEGKFSLKEKKNLIMFCMEHKLSSQGELFSEACKKNNSVILKLFFSRLDPKQCADVILPWASQTGCIETIEFLIKDRKIDPAVNDNEAIREAASNGHSKVVHMLLNDPRVNPSDYGNDAIINAWESGYGKIFDQLLECDRFDFSADRYKFLKELLSEKISYEGFEMLLKHPNFDLKAKIQAFIFAAEYGRTDIINFLIRDPKIDPSMQNHQALKFAFQNGHEDTVKVLLGDKRVNPSFSFNYAVECAANNGWFNILELLLKDKRVNPADRDDIALLAALKNKQPLAAQLLLEDKRVFEIVGQLTPQTLSFYQQFLKAAKPYSNIHEVLSNRIREGLRNEAKKRENPANLILEDGLHANKRGKY